MVRGELQFEVGTYVARGVSVGGLRMNSRRAVLEVQLVCCALVGYGLLFCRVSGQRPFGSDDLTSPVKFPFRGMSRFGWLSI